ncbi:MAG: hypothetical protein R3Y13_01530, partial [bacterium]
ITEVSSSSSWSGSNKTIHIEDIDQGSGVSKYYLVDTSSGTCPTIGYTSYDDYNTVDFDNGFYCVYVEDVVGNESEKIYFEVSGIDKTPPTTGVTYKDSVAQSIEITITSDDGEGSGIDGKGYALIRIDNDEDCEGATYTAANIIEITENGLYAACSKDKAGNTSITPSTKDDTSSLIIKINSVDRTPPVVTVTQDNADVWAQSKTISVTATDGIDTEDAKVAGVNENGYAIILSTENCETASFSSTKTKKVTVNTTYKACVVDKVGNIGEAEIVVSKVDTTNPTVTLSQSISSPYTTVTLTAKGADTQSGVYGYYFTTSSTCSTSFSAYNTKTTASYTANTTYRVCIIDNVGNVNNATISVTGIDKTPPTVTLSQSLNSIYTISTVTATASDSLSGVYGYYFTTSTTCSTSFASYNSTKTNTYTSNGTYRVCVIDKAGNTSIASINVASIDTTGPTVSISQSVNSTFTSTTVTVTASDNLSGVYGYYFTSSSSCSKTTSLYSSTRVQSYTSNGTYRVCVIDKAGNTSISSINVSTIDETKPTVSVSQSSSSGSIIATATGSDSQSGVSGYYYTTSSTTCSAYTSTYSSTRTKTYTSNGTYRACVIDKAGNTGYSNFTINSVDTTAPVGSISKKGGTSYVTLSFSATDSVGVVAYALTTSSSTSSLSWTTVSSTTSYSNTKNVVAAGTYYFYAKDAAGNISTAKSVTVYVSDISSGSSG